MKKEQFETYRFSVKTMMMLYDVWHRVTEVNFKEGRIGVDSGHYLKYDEYEGVKEVDEKGKVVSQYFPK